MDYNARNFEDEDRWQNESASQFSDRSGRQYFNERRNSGEQNFRFGDDGRDRKSGNASRNDEFDIGGRNRYEESSHLLSKKMKTDYILESSESDNEDREGRSHHSRNTLEGDIKRSKDQLHEEEDTYKRRSRFDDAKFGKKEGDWQSHDRERFSGRENRRDRSRSRGDRRRGHGQNRSDDRDSDNRNDHWRKRNRSDDDGPPGNSYSDSRSGNRKWGGEESKNEHWSKRDRNEDDGPPGNSSRENRSKSGDRGNREDEEKPNFRRDRNRQNDSEESQRGRWKNDEDKGYDRKRDYDNGPDSRDYSDGNRWNKTDEGGNDFRTPAWFCECGTPNFFSRAYCISANCKRPRLPSYRVGKFPARGGSAGPRFSGGSRFNGPARGAHRMNSPRPPTALNQAYTLADVPQLAAYSAALYATNPQETAHYMQYYTTYYTNQLTSPTTESDKVNAAAAVAQSAISQLQQAKTVAQPAASTAIVTGFENRLFPAPDVTTYLYDQSSGYYYDQTTGLYFDPKSQYYYNGQVQQFMYYNSATMTYCLMPTAGTTADATVSAVPPPPAPPPEKPTVEEKKPEKVDKSKVAKQIAKDMARWAKSMNQKKEMTAKAEAMAAEAAASIAASSGSADIGFSVLENRTSTTDMPKVSPPVPTLVSSYGDGSESDGDEDEGIIDWNKLICLLCKRQFPSKEILSKHQVMSDLHKENLSKYRVANPRVNTKVAKNTFEAYRDRAAERRSKYGEDDQPPMPPKKQFNYSAPVSSLPQEIGEDNVGNRLLKKMGWSSGQGLGREGQGRVGPVEATSGGLGTQKRGIYTAGPGETYRGCVKKLTMARYQDLVGNQDSS